MHTAIGALATAFKKQGAELYLVGGAVRDMFMREGSYDLDFSTNLTPDEMTPVLSRLHEGHEPFLQGSRFGTVGIVLLGQDIQVTTYRGETYHHGSRKPDVTFGTSITEDLRRRDFTVNAIAFNCITGQVHDPFNGLVDLHNKSLRCPGDPLKMFMEDPLRMMRAARFVARFGFVPTKLVFQAMKSRAADINHVSAERIQSELTKILLSGNPSSGLSLLYDTGVLNEILPEVAQLGELSQRQKGGYHHKDVLRHTFDVVDGTPKGVIVRYAALLHDVGKFYTRSRDASGYHFYGHEDAGAKVARVALGRIKMPKHESESIVKMVALHMRTHVGNDVTHRAARRLIFDAGDILEPLMMLSRADITSMNPNKVSMLMNRQLRFELKIAQVLGESKGKIECPVSGRDVMATLGITPSPAVGDALRWLTEAYLDGRFDTRGEGIKLLSSEYMIESAD
jgi:poly(A) polymerase